MYLSPLTVFAHVIYQNDQKTLYNQMIYFSEDKYVSKFCFRGNKNLKCEKSNIQLKNSSVKGGRLLDD